MRTVRRSMRNLARAKLRSGLLASVLGISMALALIMLTVDGAFATRLDEIKQEVGTDIAVRPAGSFGGVGAVMIARPIGGSSSSAPQPETASLEEDKIAALAEIDHVVGIGGSIMERYDGDELEAAFEPPPNLPEGVTFTVPVFVTGTSDPTNLVGLGGETSEVTHGRTFTEDESDANVALLGGDLAEHNGLAPGDTFELNGEEFTVIGLFTTGTQFGDNAIFMPLATAQRLFDRAGEVDSATVRVDHVDNVEKVAETIRETLGSDVADVSTGASQYDSIRQPVQDARKSSRLGLAASLGAGAAAILLSVGLVARQRIREIGVLKAIGASNGNITAQFGLETAMLSIAGAIVGIAIALPTAQFVADGLVSEQSTTMPPFNVTGPGGAVGQTITVGAVRPVGGPTGVISGNNSTGQDPLFGAIDVAVSPGILGYALLIAAGLAIVAASVPAWYATRIRPAEVLRYE